ncbi:MAG: hypothetical protein M0020_10970 [Actinomycetota bacterium]|nr:hypothetical protein [Actinomycetota bacterium]
MPGVIAGDTAHSSGGGVDRGLADLRLDAGQVVGAHDQVVLADPGPAVGAHRHGGRQELTVSVAVQAVHRRSPDSV